MKMILLAAAALVATPALAQTTGAAGPTGPDAKVSAQTGQMSTDAQTTDAPMPAQSGMQTQGGMPMQSDGQMGNGMSTPTTGGMTPAGGYQPTGSALTGAAQPGVQPTFRPAMSPSEAYPAPAPKASYPICKKGQYDGCMQRGGR